ncbi:alpha/beta hydrolase [Streptomyces sp. NBC_00827]|uniref:alpha/beta hydrolase n=1 Tax=Streptomyces sp. NBC_00827 TaxID=2903677 RepID=UPI00386C45A2|nr:alpha/beta hydrolase [Streptomyces sp. NBC_00827]
MNSKISQIEHDGSVFLLTADVPESKGNAATIFVHGGPGGDSRGPDDLLLDLSTELGRQGRAGFRLDMSGSAKIGGDFSDMSVRRQVGELAAAASYVRSLGYSSISLVGESLGGTVVLAAELPDIAAVVLFFPALILGETSFREVLSPEKAGERAESGGVSLGSYRLTEPFLAEVETLDVSSALQSLVCPVLIVHGDADNDVPVSQSLEAFKEMTAETRVLDVVGGGGHGLRTLDHHAHAVSVAAHWILQFG